MSDNEDDDGLRDEIGKKIMEAIKGAIESSGGTVTKMTEETPREGLSADIMATLLEGSSVVDDGVTPDRDEDVAEEIINIGSGDLDELLTSDDPEKRIIGRLYATGTFDKLADWMNDEGKRDTNHNRGHAVAAHMLVKSFAGLIGAHATARLSLEPDAKLLKSVAKMIATGFYHDLLGSMKHAAKVYEAKKELEDAVIQ